MFDQFNLQKLKFLLYILTLKACKVKLFLNPNCYANFPPMYLTKECFAS